MEVDNTGASSSPAQSASPPSLPMITTMKAKDAQKIRKALSLGPECMGPILSFLLNFARLEGQEAEFYKGNLHALDNYKGDLQALEDSH